MKSSRLKIGVDIDGVLIDTDAHAYLNFCEWELGWNVRYDVFNETHSWSEATGQDSSDVLGQAFNQFLASVEESQKPIEGAHDALKALGEIGDIFLITARAGHLLKITEEFLRTHLPDVNYFELSMGNMDMKAQRINEFKLDYFIDDSYREISMILQQKDVSTKIIPFPAFHGAPKWREMKDERIHWLSAWNDFQPDASAEQQADIREKAWQEIAQLILQPAAMNMSSRTK